MSDTTLYRRKDCEHGKWNPHQAPDPNSYAATYLCKGSEFVPVEPITVICKHNTPDALTTSLFLSPVDGKAIPEGTYALVKLGDRKDDGIGGDDEAT